MKRPPLSGAGLMATGFGDLKLFSGSAHPQLTKDIADFLGIPLGQARLRRHVGEACSEWAARRLAPWLRLHAAG